MSVEKVGELYEVLGRFVQSARVCVNMSSLSVRKLEMLILSLTDPFNEVSVG